MYTASSDSRHDRQAVCAITPSAGLALIIVAATLLLSGRAAAGANPNPPDPGVADTVQGDDPNFPRPGSDALPPGLNLKVRWSYQPGAKEPNVLINDQKLSGEMGCSAYLGYDPGSGKSLFQAHKCAVWGFELKTNSLQLMYANNGAIPLDVLYNLQHVDVDYLIVAKGGKPLHQEPVKPREPTAVELAQKQREQEAPNRQAPGVSRSDTTTAIAMLASGKTAPKPTLSGTIRGTGAKLLAGNVLSFRTLEGAEIQWKVERPPQGMQVNGAGPTPAAGSGSVAGSWLAFDIDGDPNSNRILAVDEAGNVSAQMMPAGMRQGFETLKQMMSHP